MQEELKAEVREELKAKMQEELRAKAEIAGNEMQRERMYSVLY